MQRYVVYSYLCENGCVTCESIHNTLEDASISMIKCANEYVGAHILQSNDRVLDNHLGTDVPDGYYWKFGAMRNGVCANRPTETSQTIDVYIKETVVNHGYIYNSETRTAKIVMRYGISPLKNDPSIIDQPSTPKIQPQAFEHGSHVAYIGELKAMLKNFEAPTVEYIEMRLKNGKRVDV